MPQDPNPSDCPPGLTLQDNSKCERVQARANEQPPDLTGVWADDYEVRKHCVRQYGIDESSISLRTNGFCPLGLVTTWRLHLTTPIVTPDPYKDAGTLFVDVPPPAT
ncbi:MAG: hypothetical protein F4066_07350 [Chloroflexi bacterium]|nr:hypothetical protein [Chloroflexota bacterium]MYF81781.1 hypothetical protein [Chloroflexota bacterium]MYI04662.1 hypothetical protein [Chloroflexota bacterium]